MVYLGVRSKGVSKITYEVILNEGNVDHHHYIANVLHITLKFGNYVFGKF